MTKIIPDCFWSDSANGAYVSHEAVCVLNPYEEVTVNLTLYFEDRPPLGGCAVTVPGQRTKHIRMDLLFGDVIPRATSYAIAVECDHDLAVQYTRVDTTQPQLTIATTII